MCTSFTMDSQRGPWTDLLANLAALHEDIEQQLHYVATAVNRLDHFFFSSQGAAKNTRHDLRVVVEQGLADTTASKDTTERALAGRRLHSILREGHRRILHTLSLQRVLLWKFVKGSDRVDPSPAGAANGGDPRRNFAALSTDTAPITRKQDGQHGDAASEDDDAWKHHTLIRMHHFLRRKVAEQSATTAERDRARRDMDKIDAELARLSMARLSTADAGAPSAVKTCTRTDTQRLSPSASEARLSIASLEIPGSGGKVATAKYNVGTGLPRLQEARSHHISHDTKNAPSLTASCTSKDDSYQTSPAGTISSRTCEEAAEGESTKAEESKDIVTMGKNVPIVPRSRPQCIDGQLPLAEGINAGNSRQLLQEIELRLPDGLDLWLSRIADGVRSPNISTSSAPPAAQPSLGRTTPIKPDRSCSLDHNGITPSVGEYQSTPRDTPESATPGIPRASEVFGGRLEATRRRETSDQSNSNNNNNNRKCIRIASCGVGVPGQADERAIEAGEEGNTLTTCMTRCSSVSAENVARLNGGGNVDKGAGGGEVQVVTRRNLRAVRPRAPLQGSAQLGNCMPCRPPSVGGTILWSNTNNAKNEGGGESAGVGDKENGRGWESLARRCAVAGNYPEKTR